MRKFVTVVGAAALFSLAPVNAQAQVYLGPTLSTYEFDDFGIGGTIGFDLPSVAEGVGFMGDLIVYFPEAGNVVEVNLNGTYDIPIEDSSVLPFVLGGLSILRGSGETDVNLNLGGGVGFDAGTVRPKVGLRLVVGNGNTSWAMFATLPFLVSSN